MKQKIIAAAAALLVAVIGIGLFVGATPGKSVPASSVPGTVQTDVPSPTPDVADSVPNEVDLYFPSNPTTGYGWEASAEDPGIVEIRDQYVPYDHEAGLVGVGGTHWFHLAGLKPGTTSVTFRYLRSWDPDSVNSETLYRLTVDEQMNVWIWGVEVSDLR